MTTQKEHAKLTELLSNTIIGQYSEQVAVDTQFPENTTALVGLGVASQVVSMVACVEYRDGDSIPCGLMIMGEQPSGTSKSRVINLFRKPFDNRINKENESRIQQTKMITERIAASKEEPTQAERQKLKECRPVTIGCKNTTSEALETNSFKQDGFFALATSEQGLLKTLLGFLYNNGESCDDLLLTGFDGDHYETLRVKSERNGSGFLHGSLISIAQSGQIDMIINKSNGSGLAERFLFISEPPVMGSRDWSKIVMGKSGINAGVKAMYDQKVSSIVEAFKENKTVEFNKLKRLKISSYGWEYIAMTMNASEKNNAEGGVYHNSILSGMFSKKVPNIMKIAATIHMMELDYQQGVSPLEIINSNLEIDDNTIIRAVSIVDNIFDRTVDMAVDKGITEEERRLEWLEKQLESKPKPMQTLLNAAKRNTMFKGKGCTDKLNETINEAIARHVVVANTLGSVTKFGLAA